MNLPQMYKEVAEPKLPEQDDIKDSLEAELESQRLLWLQYPNTVALINYLKEYEQSLLLQARSNTLDTNLMVSLLKKSSTINEIISYARTGSKRII